MRSDAAAEAAAVLELVGVRRAVHAEFGLSCLEVAQRFFLLILRQRLLTGVLFLFGRGDVAALLLRLGQFLRDAIRDLLCLAGRRLDAQLAADLIRTSFALGFEAVAADARAAARTYAGTAAV